ncbi:MAG: DUF4317 domain-containing protein [Christensenellales bacterium]|jgi:hypothetical protein
MNKKEISEIRRRFNPDKNTITAIRGCYVNKNKQIMSEFYQPAVSLSQEDAETYMAIFKKTLSGTAGKNLLDIVFRPDQVMQSEEHALLMALRETRLRDEARVQAFYAQVIESLAVEDDYLILLVHDEFDVFKKQKRDFMAEEESEAVFQYILCSVCPVKPGKPALRYLASEDEFHNRAGEPAVGAPELGFLFPAFDDRAANIYNALFYSRGEAAGFAPFIEALFQAELPMPASAQREAFEQALEESLGEELNFEVVRTLNETIRAGIEAHKADREAEPLTISKREVQKMLRDCGVAEARVEAFDAAYDAAIGRGVDLGAQHIVDAKQFSLRTQDIAIRADPDQSDQIETRIIDGIKYILIRADEGVEVNGMRVRIADQSQ